MSDEVTSPLGVQTSLTVAMPRDTNPGGDIFGGWLMSQMDLAGGVAAARRAHGRTVTIAVNGMVFHHPVKVGDLVACYADIHAVGRTSITIGIEAWASSHYFPSEPVRVTEGVFTYVAIDKDGQPRALEDE